MIEYADMRHGDALLTRPVGLLMVCCACLLEWVKSIDLMVPYLLHFISCLTKKFVAAEALSLLDVASVWVCNRSLH